VEDVHNGIPTLGEFPVACLNSCGIIWWEGIEQMPDRRARKTVHLLDTKKLGRACGIHDLLCRSLSNTFRFTIAPHMRWKSALVTLINEFIGYCLTNQMRTDSPATKAMLL